MSTSAPACNEGGGEGKGDCGGLGDSSCSMELLHLMRPFIMLRPQSMLCHHQLLHAI